MTLEFLHCITLANFFILTMSLGVFLLPHSWIPEGWDFFSGSVMPAHSLATESSHLLSFCNSTLAHPLSSLPLSAHPSGLSLIMIGDCWYLMSNCYELGSALSSCKYLIYLILIMEKWQVYHYPHFIDKKIQKHAQSYVAITWQNQGWHSSCWVQACLLNHWPALPPFSLDVTSSEMSSLIAYIYVCILFHHHEFLLSWKLRNCSSCVFPLLATIAWITYYNCYSKWKFKEDKGSFLSGPRK